MVSFSPNTGNVQVLYSFPSGWMIPYYTSTLVSGLYVVVMNTPTSGQMLVTWNCSSGAMRSFSLGSAGVVSLGASRYLHSSESNLMCTRSVICCCCCCFASHFLLFLFHMQLMMARPIPCLHFVCRAKPQHSRASRSFLPPTLRSPRFLLALLRSSIPLPSRALRTTSPCVRPRISPLSSCPWRSRMERRARARCLTARTSPSCKAAPRTDLWVGDVQSIDDVVSRPQRSQMYTWQTHAVCVSYFYQRHIYPSRLDYIGELQPSVQLALLRRSLRQAQLHRSLHWLSWLAGQDYQAMV